jgi:hypothetical protein
MQPEELILIAAGSHDLAPWWEIPMMGLGLRHLFQLPSMQRWAQPMNSAHRTPLIDRHFAENLIPTDGHSYKALEIFWSFDLFGRLASRPRRNDVWTIANLIITAGHDPTFSQEMGENSPPILSTPSISTILEPATLMAEDPHEVTAAISEAA